LIGSKSWIGSIVESGFRYFVFKIENWVPETGFQDLFHLKKD